LIASRNNCFKHTGQLYEKGIRYNDMVIF